ncbi:MAG: TIGR02391 family protein [Dermatophilaceae bacterium]
MANLDNTTKLKLESLLSTSGGYVLDLSNAAFADFVQTSIGIHPYEKYGSDLSKAKLLRVIWEREPNASVCRLNLDLLEHMRVTRLLANDVLSEAEETLRRELVDQFAEQAEERSMRSDAGAPVTFTTEASVTANKIQIEIHDDIYDHIGQYLATGDFFHAVEESYKLVREKLREVTGHEKASDVFNNSAQNVAHSKALFGKATPATAAEADFFRGIGYLHLGVQHLRNEKAHTPASPIDPNLAIHYIALASLAYDLITRYVGDETIQEIEDLVRAKRRGYRSATAFYNDFENGKWLKTLDLPVNLHSSSVRKVLKKKWMDDADFTRSWDHSNVVLMQFELVAVELTSEDIDRLLDLPTRDSYGNDQQAGMLPFLEFIQQEYPEKISPKAERWISDNTRD